MSAAPAIQYISLLHVAYHYPTTVYKDVVVIEEPAISDTTVTGGLLWIKAVCNIINFAFAGKAYLFDGSSFKELGTPVAVIYPVAASDGNAAYLAGGLEEDGGIPDTVYGYGIEASELEADKDYIAFIIGEETVYVIDVENVVRAKVVTGAAPFQQGWKMVSRKPFVAIVMEVK